MNKQLIVPFKEYWKLIEACVLLQQYGPDINLETNNETVIAIFGNQSISINYDNISDFNVTSDLHKLLSFAKNNEYLIANLFNNNYVNEIQNNPLYKYVGLKTKSFEVCLHNKVTYAAPQTMDDIYDSKVDLNVNGNTYSGREYTRTLCLSKDSINHALWGLYADKFKGARFEYKVMDLLGALNDKDFDILLLGDVNYTDSSIYKQKAELYSRNKNLSIVHDQFYKLLSKENSWSFENEFRIILFKYNKKGFPDYKEVPTRFISLKTFESNPLLNSKNTTWLIVCHYIYLKTNYGNRSLSIKQTECEESILNEILLFNPSLDYDNSIGFSIDEILKIKEWIIEFYNNKKK